MPQRGWEDLEVKKLEMLMRIKLNPSQINRFILKRSTSSMVRHGSEEIGNADVPPMQTPGHDVLPIRESRRLLAFPHRAYMLLARMIHQASLELSSPPHPKHRRITCSTFGYQHARHLFARNSQKGTALDGQTTNEWKEPKHGKAKGNEGKKQNRNKPPNGRWANGT